MERATAGERLVASWSWVGFGSSCEGGGDELFPGALGWTGSRRITRRDEGIMKDGS
jgi:hypothetical protein